MTHVNKNMKNETHISNTTKLINNVDERKKRNYHMILIFAVLCILPFLVRYLQYESKLNQFPWFPDQIYSEDFFLLLKQRFFLLISSVMALYLLYAVIRKKRLKDSKIFIPLAVYAMLTILSTIFSKYRTFSLTGSYDMF